MLKKFEKKIKRIQHVLLKDGIVTTSKPANHLVICNAGLVNGLSEEILVNSFEKYGAISDILMPPGKSYCFLSFASIESANKCYISCNGKLHIAQDDKPILLCFLETLPEVVDKRTWNILPSGLIILENFVTEDEEELLFNLPNFNEQECGSMKNRQVKHYGFEFKYDVNNVDKNNSLPNGLPTECDLLWPRLAERYPKFANFLPDQLTVNKYLPGQGIPSHVDTHSAFIDPLLSLSLGSSIVMEFKHENGSHNCVLLPRKSLAIMSGESRYWWTHGIMSRKYDVIRKNNKCNLLVRDTRISYTFRKLREGECTCEFQSKCDSFLRKQQEFHLTDEIAAQLERTHVHEVYENIAGHFSDTRHKPWPNIMKFIESLDKGSILVDIGCGNGKYLGNSKDIFDLGCDRSFGLIDVCKDRGFQALTCDCLSVPLRDETADACICIAVIHHLATEERRLRALKEIVRILKTDGRALIYVWAKDQFSNNKKSKYIKEDKKEEKEISDMDSLKGSSLVEGVSLPIHTNRTQFKHKDLLVPWKLKTNSENKGTFLRYYHVYEKHELESVCAKLSNIEITSSYYDQGNWCVMLRKIKNL